MSEISDGGNGKNDGEVLQLLKEKLNKARFRVRLERENHLTKWLTIINILKCARDQKQALMEIMAASKRVPLGRRERDSDSVGDV